MRTFGLVLLLCVSADLLWAESARADTIVSIADNYIGGTVSTKTSSGWTPVSSSNSWYQKDLVGDPTMYEVYGMTVTYNFAANSLKVAIESSYFDNVGSDTTSMGDLFISTNGWNMGSQSAPYKTDTHTTGEQWEYVLVLDHHGAGYTSGTLSLYAISSGTINLTTAPTNDIFRADQEASFTPGSGVSAIATGTWSITDNSGDHDFLTFNINLSGAGYNLMGSGAGGLGFHWAMSCGNDTIEGFAPTPEPATMFLMAAGLAGVASRRRRKQPLPA